MSTSLPQERQSLLDRMERYWQAFAGVFRRSELDSLDAADARRIAQDLAVSPKELCALARYAPDSADLLLRRLQALRLDPAEVARAEPLAFRDMQRVCMLCASKGRCARDFEQHAGDPTWQEWRDYCPNAAMLNLYSTIAASWPERWRSEKSVH